MKKQINDLLLKMQTGENCIGDTANQLLDLFAVSGSTFTIYDMKKAFMAGADKKYWTKIHLTCVVSGQDYVLEPVFEKWFEYYR